eukprot:gene4596-14787_t
MADAEFELEPRGLLRTPDAEDQEGGVEEIAPQGRGEQSAPDRLTAPFAPTTSSMQIQKALKGAVAPKAVRSIHVSQMVRPSAVPHGAPEPILSVERSSTKARHMHELAATQTEAAASPVASVVSNPIAVVLGLGIAGLALKAAVAGSKKNLQCRDRRLRRAKKKPGPSLAAELHNRTSNLAFYVPHLRTRTMLSALNQRAVRPTARITRNAPRKTIVSPPPLRVAIAINATSLSLMHQPNWNTTSSYSKRAYATGH